MAKLCHPNSPLENFSHDLMAQNSVYKFHLEKTYFQISISMTWSENKLP